MQCTGRTSGEVAAAEGGASGGGRHTQWCKVEEAVGVLSLCGNSWCCSLHFISFEFRDDAASLTHV